MTDAVASAIIGGIALVLAALIGVISGQLKDRNATRREQVRVEARHQENLKRLNELDSVVRAVRSELPHGGLQQWIEAVTANTKALNKLAGSMSHLESRVDEHDSLIAQLRGGGTA